MTEPKNMVDIVKRLGRHESPQSLGLSTTPEGYTNLHGIVFSPTVIHGKVKFKEESHVFENLFLDHVDFTGADIEGTRWINCEFTHIKFDRVMGSHINFTNSRIRHSSFVKADLRYANWGWKDPPDPLIEDCVFERTDLRKTTHSHPLFCRCRFTSCKFNGTSLSARFEDCVFEGVVDSVGFSAWERQEGQTFRWNQMRNVDFSRAELRHVAFCGGIDLTTCRFPETGYLRIPHPRAAFTKALETARKWPGQRAKDVVAYLQNIIKQCLVEEQPFDIVRPEDFIEYFGEEAGRALLEELTKD